MAKNNNKYVTIREFNMLRDEVKEIKDNHLVSIQKSIDKLDRRFQKNCEESKEERESLRKEIAKIMKIVLLIAVGAIGSSTLLQYILGMG